MKQGNVYLMDLDFEYKLWKNRLSCFLKEIEIVKARNEEMTKHHPGKEMNTVEMMVLEEHEAQLHQVLNRIKVQEQEIQYYNKDFPLTQSHEYMVLHLKIRDKMEQMCTLHLDKLDDMTRALGI